MLRHNTQAVYNALVQRLANKPYFVDFRTELDGLSAPYLDDGATPSAQGRDALSKALARELAQRLDLNSSP